MPRRRFSSWPTLSTVWPTKSSKPSSVRKHLRADNQSPGALPGPEGADWGLVAAANMLDGSIIPFDGHVTATAALIGIAVMPVPPVAIAVTTDAQGPHASLT